jgi:hypothetical protein
MPRYNIITCMLLFHPLFFLKVKNYCSLYMVGNITERNVSLILLLLFVLKLPFKPHFSPPIGLYQHQECHNIARCCLYLCIRVVY